MRQICTTVREYGEKAAAKQSLERVLVLILFMLFWERTIHQYVIPSYAHSEFLDDKMKLVVTS